MPANQDTDAQFLSYVTHPSLPALLEILFADAGARRRPCSPGGIW